MSVPLEPMADNIVAQAEKPETKTASGLYLPESAQEKSKVAKVVAVGAAVREVKKGDRIIYKSFTPTEVSVGKEDFIIVREEDVLAKVK